MPLPEETERLGLNEGLDYVIGFCDAGFFDKKLTPLAG